MDELTLRNKRAMTSNAMQLYVMFLGRPTRVRKASNDRHDGFVFALYPLPCQKYGELDRLVCRRTVCMSNKRDALCVRDINIRWLSGSGCAYPWLVQSPSPRAAEDDSDPEKDRSLPHPRPAFSPSGPDLSLAGMWRSTGAILRSTNPRDSIPDGGFTPCQEINISLLEARCNLLQIIFRLQLAK